MKRFTTILVLVLGFSLFFSPAKVEASYPSYTDGSLLWSHLYDDPQSMVDSIFNTAFSLNCNNVRWGAFKFGNMSNYFYSTSTGPVSVLFSFGTNVDCEDISNDETLLELYNYMGTNFLRLDGGAVRFNDYTNSFEQVGSYQMVSLDPRLSVVGNYFGNLDVYTVSNFPLSAFGTTYGNLGSISGRVLIANRTIAAEEPILPIAGPPQLKEFTLEYYTEDFPSPKYIQASSDEPCVVEWAYGIAGYYDLICPSVDFNLGDSSVPSLTITYDTYAIYIPDTSSPCTHIKSINYSLFDTTGQFLCSPIVNPISSNYVLPGIPLIDLIPPEADWGAFDFLKPAINLFLGAFNSLLQAINSTLQTVISWFIPNPDTIRTSVNQIKDLFAEKLPIEAMSIGFNNVKNAMLSNVVAKPTSSTAIIMNTSVPLVNWDLVDANITLIRNILNAIFYISLLLVLSKLGRKVTSLAV